MGSAQPATIRNEHIDPRVEAAVRNQQNYHLARQQRSLDDLRQIARHECTLSSGEANHG